MKNSTKKGKEESATKITVDVTQALIDMDGKEMDEVDVINGQVIKTGNLITWRKVFCNALKNGAEDNEDAEKSYKNIMLGMKISSEDKIALTGAEVTEIENSVKNAYSKARLIKAQVYKLFNT